MGWFLCICFVILIVCVIIQTYYLTKTSKQIFEYKEFNCKPFIALYDKNDTFVFIDQIASISLLDGSEIDSLYVFEENIRKDKFYIRIVVNYSSYFEEYETKDEATDRVNELLDFIDTYYK